MDLFRDTTLARLVLDHPACATVFQERRIDFCCEGDVTVAEACASRRLDELETLAALERALAAERSSPGEDPRTMVTLDLVAHVVERHHGTLRAALPFLGPLAAKVASVHGEHNPKLVELHEVFLDLRDTLEAHLDREEEALFQHLASPAPDSARIEREIAAARREHFEVRAALCRIRELADDFTAPAWACSSYRKLLSELRALEDEALRHVLVENHVLFPRLAA